MAYVALCNGLGPVPSSVLVALQDGVDGGLGEPGELGDFPLRRPTLDGLEDEAVAAGLPLAALPSRGRYPPGEVPVDHQNRPAENWLMSDGAVVSNPTTSRAW